MQWSIWLALVSACVLISFTPGAGAVNTMTNAINVGFRRAIWGILGQQAALMVQLLIVAAGLGILISRSPAAFTTIRYVGATYLIYLGIRQFLRKPQPAVGDDDGPPQQQAESAWSMFVRGLWVNLANPKAIVFLLAFVPGFVRPGDNLLLQYLIIGVTIVAVDVTVMWLFFALIGRGFARMTRSERGQRRLNRLFGTLFIGVGVMLALL